MTTTAGSIGIVLFRLVAGAAFVMHGWSKIKHPASWMGPESHVPALFQALAAVAEFGGGFGWILGLFTPLASFGILCTMLVAITRHAFVRGDPFVGAKSSYELAAAYLCLSVLLLLTGPGRFSIDEWRGRHRLTPDKDIGR